MDRDTCVLKSREDPTPVLIKQIKENRFELSEASQCSWLKLSEEFGP